MATDEFVSFEDENVSVSDDVQQFETGRVSAE